MNYPLLLAALAVAVSGCAADFSEEKTNAPESSEETTSEPTVNVYGGDLQRPAESVGTVEDAPRTANARAIRNYMPPVEQAEIELGPKLNGSQTR